MLLPIAFIVLAYLLGALSGSLLLGRVLGKADVRSTGSGNAGATNALRTGGAGYGAAVLVFDLAKGLVAVGLLPLLAGAGVAMWLPYACGAAVVVGHVWPVYFGFRGGKGAATLIGVLLGLLPLALVPALVVWVLTLVLTGFVGLSVLLGMTTVVAVTIYWHAGVLLATPAVVFTLSMWLLVIYTHRINIQRMLDGSEHRFTRVMLLHRQ